MHGLVAASQLGGAASASSAQTITVGPEPDSVAPTAPVGRSARISSRSGDGRYGWCSRSSKAAVSQSAPARGDPGAEQRRPGDVEGRVGVRDLGGQREARLGGRAPSPRGPPPPASAAASRRSARSARPRSARRRRRGRRPGCRSGPRAARRERAGPRARAPAPSTSSPRPSRARSSPRSSRARARAGCGPSTRTTAPRARRRGRTRGCRCAPGRAARRSLRTSTSFHRSSATRGAVEPRAEVRRGRGRARPHSRSTASGILEPVAGEHADDPPLGPNLRDPGHARCGGRLAEQPLEPRDRLPPLEQLGIAHRHDLGHPSTCSRCTGSTMRIAEPTVVARSPDCTDRIRGRRVAEPAEIGGRVPAAAVREREHVGQPAELLDDLARGRRLALDPVRVDRVHVDPALLLGEPPRLQDARP